MEDGERASSTSAGMRWFLPGLVVWAQVMLSAFVFERRVPDAVRASPSPLLVVLLIGGPLVSLAILIQARRMDRAPERRSPAGDALVLWLLGFCFSAHALVMAVVTGALTGLQPGLGLAVGALLLGGAGLLPALPYRSPFGLVHRSTLSSPSAWRSRHRRVAAAAAVSGILCLGSLWFPRAPFLVLALAPVWVTTLAALRSDPGGST